jgi:hypothetical protein
MSDTSASLLERVGGFVPYLPGGLHEFPAPSGAYSVVRFTTPADGLYALSTTFEGSDVRGATTDVHVLLDNVSIFDGNVNGFGPTKRCILFQNSVAPFG